MNQCTQNRLLTEIEVANMLGISTNTLKNWRSQKKGPTYCKIPSVRYRASDIDDFISNSEVKHTSAGGATI